MGARLLRSIIATNTSTRVEWLYLSLILVSLSLRLFHLTGPIDSPHAWRQSDTAYYAQSFYQSGIDLLNPKVSWSGKFDTVALEFPLPEAIMALAYKMFGFDLLWARLVVLGFFIGSLIYLFKIIKWVSTPRLAWMTTLVYSFLPLSLFFSRAVHVDFAAVFFAHAMLYHFLAGFDGRPSHIVMGTIMGCLGFAIKPPYLFYLYLPLAAFLWHRKIWKTPYRRWLPALILPVIAFFLWQRNVGLVNSAKPALDVYPKLVDRYEWYFGTLSMRFQIVSWILVLRNFLFEVATPTGLMLMIGGGWAWIRSKRTAWQGQVRETKVPLFFESWSLGTGVYVLLFFNLNRFHNYYQIPLLAITAFFIAVCLDMLLHIRPKYGPVSAGFVLFMLTCNVLVYSNQAYFQIDWRVHLAGQIIQMHSEPDDLVLTYLDECNQDRTDPRLLYSAQRRGWSLNESDLTPERLGSYASQGGRFLAVIDSTPDGSFLPAWLKASAGKQFSLVHDGKSLGTLHFFDLSELKTFEQ
jgi:4-amino-4-deoxy-L-arabinose transferase-like glycosyltransferase